MSRKATSGLRRELRGQLRDAAADSSFYRRKRQDTNAAIRRAQHAKDAVELRRLRAELPLIERALRRADADHARIKAELTALRHREGGQPYG